MDVAARHIIQAPVPCCAGAARAAAKAEGLLSNDGFVIAVGEEALG